MQKLIVVDMQWMGDLLAMEKEDQVPLHLDHHIFLLGFAGEVKMEMWMAEEM